MLNITTTSITMLKIIVELDEPAARDILVDPSSFQSQLRSRLAQSHNGHALRQAQGAKGAKAKRHPKAVTRTASGQRKRIERAPCANCGNSIPVYLQGKHKCRMAIVSTAASSD